MFNRPAITGWDPFQYLGGVELDPGLPLDERGGELHDDGLDRVRGRPALNKMENKNCRSKN